MSAKQLGGAQLLVVSLLVAVVSLRHLLTGSGEFDSAFWEERAPPDFGDVFLPEFSRPRQNVSFVVDMEGDGFRVFVLSGSPPIHAPEAYSLIAKLRGPEDSYFSCYLFPLRDADNRPSGGALSCPSSHLRALAPGQWSVSVMLFRSQTHNPECGAGIRHSTPRMRLLDFILAKRFATFPESLRCFSYPRSTVLEFTWDKTLPPPTLEPARCTSEAAGEWVAYPGECAAPYAGSRSLCKGALDPSLLRKQVNVKRRIHHVFVPFTCHYRIFSKKKAKACLRRRRPVLIGDSRARMMTEATHKWLGEAATPGTLDFHYWTQDHFGLQKPMYSAAARQHSLDTLLEMVGEGRTVVIDSMLHDLADYRNETLVGDVLATFPASVCDAAVCEKEASVGECGCPSKLQAVSLYIQNLRHLAGVLAEVKAQQPDAKLFWLTNHRREPMLDERMYAWQVNDVIHAVEEEAATVMEGAGIPHIDYRHHVNTAPWYWWSDTIHYGGLTQFVDARPSLFKHQSLQILLNRIC